MSVRTAGGSPRAAIAGIIVGASLLAGCSVPGVGGETEAGESSDDNAYLLEEGEEGGTAATSTAPPPTEPAPMLLPTLDERMSQLSAAVGGQYSAINIVETFEMPDDVPIFGGSVTGTFVGAVMDDQGVIRESRIVGTDDVINVETLSAFNDTVTGDAESGWAVELLNEDAAAVTSVLLAKDQSGAVFVGRSFLEPLPQSASFQHEHIFIVDTMALPTWISAMPLPAGGVMVSYREGVGRVVDRDQSGQNGYVEVLVHYPPESAAAIEQLYAGDALSTAGFQRSAPEFVIGTELQIAQGPWSGSVVAAPRQHLGADGVVVRIALVQPAG